MKLLTLWILFSKHLTKYELNEILVSIKIVILFLLNLNIYIYIYRYTLVCTSGRVIDSFIV